MANKIFRLLLSLLGFGKLTPEWLRKHGAIVGSDVELYSVKCSENDATCLEIGNHVTISGTQIITHDASLKRFIGKGCNKIGRVVIGDNVFIGIHTVILPNVHIGNNVVIGAGSVVSNDIPNNSVAAGNPARVICTIEDYIDKHRERMKNENLIYINRKRNKMSSDELREFNKEIDGKIVYILNDKLV